MRTRSQAEAVGLALEPAPEVECVVVQRKGGRGAILVQDFALESTGKHRLEAA
jgi:hypothetical protein